MERHHRQPTAGGKYTLRRRQAIGQFAQLAVDMDADRLEGPRRGVLLVMRLVAERFPHDPRKLPGARDRAVVDDRLRDTARARFLAIFLDHERDLGFVGFVDEIGGAQAFLAHPHVERTVRLERETALGLVELHRRYADIHRHALHGILADVGQHLLHLGKWLWKERKAASVLRFEISSFAQRVGVAVKRNYARAAL